MNAQPNAEKINRANKFPTIPDTTREANAMSCPLARTAFFDLHQDGGVFLVHMMVGL